MILWRDFLAKLADDGVFLDSAEEEDLSEEGGRLRAVFLWRQVGRRVLHFTLPELPSPDAEVPRFLRRQIANVLRLPPEKYVFPEA